MDRIPDRSARRCPARRFGERDVPNVVAAAVTALLVVFGSACSDTGADFEGDRASADTSGFGGGGGGSGGDNNQPPDEKEKDFEFSTPAVADQTIYVANTTLDAVAAIDTETLSIQTIPAGFRPTEVAGPAAEHADDEEARVMVLNEGGSSVTVIDPSSRETTRRTIKRGSNALEMDPKGRFGITWYDDTKTGAADDPGDLSSVTVVTGDATYEIAVGFHVRDVEFSSDGSRALVWTDDGVSRIDLTELDSDGTAAPIRLLPDAIGPLEPGDLEIAVTEETNYVVTRSGRLRGVVLLEVDEKTRHIVPTFEVPTDVDLFRAGNGPEVLVTLRETGRTLRIELPGGFTGAADALADRADDIVVDDGTTAGSMDAGSSDSGTSNGATADVGATDAGTADVGATDSGHVDVGASDADAFDSGTPNAGTGDVGDADSGPPDDASDDGADSPGDTSDAREADAGKPAKTFPEIDGFQAVDIEVDGLDSASVATGGREALLYPTVGDEKRVVLLDLEDLGQRSFALQKKVRGALSDGRGDTFIVYNQKQPGDIPPDATPNNPEYIARSWGMTLVDIETATTRLLLTQYKPGPTAIWSPPSGDAKTYTIFEPPPAEAGGVEPARRDVIETNLTTFRTRTYRVPSTPQAVGPIAPAAKVFVSQRHPQGRMTFIDAETRDRQTITGYQLNSEIE